MIPEGRYGWLRHRRRRDTRFALRGDRGIPFGPLRVKFYRSARKRSSITKKNVRSAAAVSPRFCCVTKRLRSAWGDPCGVPLDDRRPIAAAASGPTRVGAQTAVEWSERGWVRLHLYMPRRAWNGGLNGVHPGARCRAGGTAVTPRRARRLGIAIACSARVYGAVGWTRASGSVGTAVPRGSMGCVRGE